MICPHCGEDTEKNVITRDLKVTRDGQGRKKLWHETTWIDGKLYRKRLDTYFYKEQSRDPYRINMKVFDHVDHIISDINTV